MDNKKKEYPITEIRKQFPALARTYQGKPVVYFDGPGGSQVVQSAIEAMITYMSKGGANLHGVFPTSIETEAMLVASRAAVADMFKALPQEVAFGANMTSLTFSVSRALGKTWQAGDEIILSQLDHRANVDPWLAVAEEKGLHVRWLKVNPSTLTLDLSQLDSIFSQKTKLVALGLASNAVGTINDIPTIAAAAKQVGALVAVDAVHAAPHVAIDRNQLGIDILLCSAYKFFGPHVGIAVIKEALFKQIQPYKLVPAPSYLPDKLETGTQNHEGIAGLGAAIEFLASLGVGSSRSEQIKSGLELIEAYEHPLAETIRTELALIPGIQLYQAEAMIPKTPTIAFRVEGLDPEQICRELAEKDAIFIASGDFYASTLAQILGIDQHGGWIRAGLAPYNTQDEAERFIEALRRYSRK